MIKKLQDSQIVRYILTGGMTTGINYLTKTSHTQNGHRTLKIQYFS